MRASNSRLIAEELTELYTFKGERPHVALGNHCRRGRPFRQESDFAYEVASFQMRDLTASDRDAEAARANEENSFQRLIFRGQRRAIGNIAKLAGDEQARDLQIVEALERTLRSSSRSGSGRRNDRRSLISR